MSNRTTISVDKATKNSADDLKPTNMSWNAFIRACLKAFEDAKGDVNSDMNSGTSGGTRFDDVRVRSIDPDVLDESAHVVADVVVDRLERRLR